MPGDPALASRGAREHSTQVIGHVPSHSDRKIVNCAKVKLSSVKFDVSFPYLNGRRL